MGESEEKAAMYRQRANELRIIAGEMLDAGYRKTLLKIADDYDLLADFQVNLGKDKLIF